LLAIVIDNCGTASSDLAHLVTMEGGAEAIEKVIEDGEFEVSFFTLRSSLVDFEKKTLLIFTHLIFMISSDSKKNFFKNKLGMC
jgi:hypothetical protein